MATATRKAPAPAAPTRAKAEEAMRAHKTATTQLSAVEAQKKLEQIALDEKYSKKLAELTEAANTSGEVVQQYAGANPQIFGAAKSVKLAGAIIGYRSGPEKLELIADWDWEKVEANLEDDYKKSSVTVDKKALLDAVRNKPEWAAEVGVQVIREEFFFIKI